MIGYDVQQVCLGGHQINARTQTVPAENKPYCPQCGQPTIRECPNCRSPIRGAYISEYVVGGGAAVPSNCEKCGNPFPWTVAKAKFASMPNTETRADALDIVLRICSRFHLVAKQLDQRHGDRPTLEIADEYDVQDLLHALLHIAFDDVRREEWTPSYAGSASRVDFLLPQEKIVVEVKKTRQTLKAKEVGEQLIVDIARYQKHPDCKTLICFVYDPEGRLSNPNGLENDLKKEGDFSVRVVIVPKGY